jgi:hypothetical protein
MRLDDEFDVLVDVQQGRFKVHVRCTYVSTQIYRFLITGGEREMVLRTDFPFIHSQKKRSKPASWKIEQGDKPKSGVAFYTMIEKIEHYLKKDLQLV